MLHSRFIHSLHIAIGSVALAAWQGAAAAIAPPPLQPVDGNTYDFYVAGQETYDSNLYRLPTVYPDIATRVSPNATRSDRVTTGSLGGDAQWLLGRQVLEFNLRADENRFTHNTDLNNTSGYANFLLNWQAGPYLTGQAGANYNHQLAAFDETRNLGRDLTDTTEFFGVVRYQLGPHWALNGRATDTNISHSARNAAYNNFHLKSGNFNVEYDTNVRDSVAFEYRYADGSFPPNNLFQLNNVAFTPSYHEQVTRAILKYAFSDKTTLDAAGGYLKRNFTTVSLGAFSGTIWRAELTYIPTDKTQMLVSAWHELHAYLVNESDYFVSQGVSVAPVWNATEKITATLSLAYEKQNYISQTPAVNTLGALHAKVATEQLSVVYYPRPHWILNVLLNHQKRDSNQITYVFDDQIATVSVIYRIH